MKTRIHVNRHIIQRNKQHGTNDPVITAKDYKRNRYGHEARIVDGDDNIVARVVYRPDRPLSCGAVLWVETDLKVEVE